jgi:uncharacterized protein Yka (UPF0111/DUF47 family)
LEAFVRIFPKDERFFDLFADIAKRLSGSAELLNRLFADPQHLEVHVTAIKELEHQADHLTHDVVARIDKSFITPIDREDIYQLASSLDDVIDLIDGAARRASMFRITQTKEPAVKLTELLIRAGKHIELAVAGLKKPAVVSAEAQKVKIIEEEGDSVYHEAVGRLFDGTPDPLDVIKWKELYDRLEDAIDQCEDVMNVLESISIKNG